MSPLRRALARVVGIWLICQTAGLSVVPLASLSWQTVMVADQCECPGVGPGQVCPMHHTQKGKRRCVLDKAYSASSLALMSLLGGIGLMPPAHTTGVQAVAAESVRAVTGFLVHRSDRPESPPPRS